MLATQTLPLKPFKTMAITVDGTLRYSKRKTGAFPSEAEVVQAVA